MRISKILSGALATVVLLLGAAAPALAGKPYLDSGIGLNQTDPYKDAQVISEITGSRGIYGKLEGSAPVDIYKFTAKEDGEQTFGLLVRKNELSDLSEPTLIFMDPTDATTAKELGVPLPGEGYHSAVINATERDSETKEFRTYNEPVLMEQYALVAEQVVKLQKDVTYYLIVLDPGQLVTHYGIRLGTQKAWTFGDYFSSFGDWWRLKLDIYGASSPFSFPVAGFGLVLFWLGFVALFGMFLVQGVFGLMSLRQRTAAYLLVKLQPYSRIAIWTGLWLMLIGGYIFARQESFTGLVFLLTLIFDFLIVVMLVTTFKLAPSLMKVEISKKEAVLPRKDLQLFYITFILGMLGLLAMLVFSIMLIAQ